MSFKNIIRANAEAIVDLHRRTKETLENRDKGEQEEQLWREACEEFHSRYSELAFPGGVDSARERLRSGECEAIAYALDFLEVRPYFFRSGYMYKDFLRVLKNCPLSTSQSPRLLRILERYEKYRLGRRS